MFGLGCIEVTVYCLGRGAVLKPSPDNVQLLRQRHLHRAPSSFAVHAQQQCMQSKVLAYDHILQAPE
jgi:hypothetical protein